MRRSGSFTGLGVEVLCQSLIKIKIREMAHERASEVLIQFKSFDSFLFLLILATLVNYSGSQSEWVGLAAIERPLLDGAKGRRKTSGADESKAEKISRQVARVRPSASL